MQTCTSPPRPIRSAGCSASRNSRPRTVCLVGIEGTGSYGAGLARHVAAAGIRVVEADRSDRHAVTVLVAETAALRPRPGSTVGYATRIALRELGRRAQFPGRPAPGAWTS